MPIRASISVFVSVACACVASGIGLYLLIHSRINNDALAVALGFAVVVLPVSLVVWIQTHFARVSSTPPIDEHVADGPWLEVRGGDEEGYTLAGNAAALEALGRECLRIAREGGAGDSASFAIGQVEISAIVRQDVRPVPEPLTWKDKLASAGCLFGLLLGIAVWFRGCVAIEKDIERWLR